MKEFKYRITIDYLEDNQGNKQDCPPIIFEISNHDDLFKIIKLARQSEKPISDNANPLIVGLKLFTDVCMKNGDNPTFSSLKPKMIDIVKILKPLIKP